MSLFRRSPALLTGVSLALLGVYLVALLGVLPSPRVVAGWFGQAAGERYPCESCGCGCASATECWTHCCCHSEHERLVWAIENGVMPPPVAQFSDTQWVAAYNDVQPGGAHCTLCVEQIKNELRRGIALRPVNVAACAHGDACDGHCGSDLGKTCGETASTSKPAGGHSGCSKNDDAPHHSWPGPSISAISCKGLQQLLTTTLPPSPPASATCLILPEPTPFVPDRPDDLAYPSRALDVPEPPPRQIALLG